MSKSIAISIVLPTFNRRKSLERSIESILRQTYQNWELIIIDDGSTDSTSEIKSYLSDSRIKYFYQTNQGVSSARNSGIRKSQFEWVAFIDSDDQWLPEKLEKQVAVIERTDAQWVHCEESWVRNGVLVNVPKKYKKTSGDIFLNCLSVCCVGPSTVIIKKDTLMEFGGFDNAYPVCEDYDLWLKLSLAYPIGFVDEALVVKYGGHSDQLSLKYKAMDLWRVRSLWQTLKRIQNLQLQIEDKKKTALQSVLRDKIKVLLRGYLKHSNRENFNEVYSYWFQLQLG